jgi:hypothetical protein
MASHQVTHVVPKEKLAAVEKLCGDGPATDCGSDEVIFEAGVFFPDGMHALVQAIAPLDPSSGGCWTQAVLFEKRGDLYHEVGCTDVGESLAGEYTIEHGGNEYTVVVESAR